MGIFDIFLLEAVINGLLLGGVLALLSLGLNLVFGVIDVVWICYAEQQAIDHRLEQEDVEDAHGRRSPQTPRYASRMLSLARSSAARPAVWMWPVLSR